jgi:Zn-dependent protease with chaperone function
VFLLQRITNVAKGTSFFGGMAGLPLVSQLGTFVSPLLVLIVIIVLPMLLFMMLIETEVGRAIGAIERERAALKREGLAESSPARRESLRERDESLRRRRHLVRQQRPWPRRNAVYRTLLVACVLFLVVLPFTIEFVDLADRLPSVSRGIARLSEILCWLSKA